MNLALQRSEIFIRDFDLQVRWYLRNASPAQARRYLAALQETLRLLTVHPGMGRLRRFRHPELAGLHSFRLPLFPCELS